MIGIFQSRLTHQYIKFLVRQMQTSKNELTSLLKQALEGCGLNAGAYEDAADVIIWNTMHGFSNFNLLEKRFELLSNSTHKTIEHEFVSHLDNDELSLENRKIKVKFDAKQQSILQFVGRISDCLCDQAMRQKSVSAIINNCMDQVLILKKLSDSSQRGLTSTAIWKNENLTVNFALAREGSHCPILMSLGTDVTNTLSVGTLYLNYAISPETLFEDLSSDQELSVIFEVYQKFEQQLNNTNATVLSTEQSIQNYQHCLMNGILIDDRLWELMIEYGNNVLVESTELSRMGAGA